MGFNSGFKGLKLVSKLLGRTLYISKVHFVGSMKEQFNYIKTYGIKTVKILHTVVKITNMMQLYTG